MRALATLSEEDIQTIQDGGSVVVDVKIGPSTYPIRVMRDYEIDIHKKGDEQDG